MQPTLTRKLEILVTFQSLKLLIFNSVCISRYDQQAAWQLTPPVNGLGYSEITLWSMGPGKTVRCEIGIALGSHAAQ